MLALLLLTSWFQEVASAASPMGADAHVLLREESVIMDQTGRQTITTRGVVRILTPAGAHHARAGVAYDSAAGQLLEFRAWVQAPGGEAHEIDPQEFIDRPLSPAELHSPLRQRQIEANAPPGSVFFYQSTVVAPAAFPQVEFEFQESELPVHLSRFRLSAPAGWEVQAISFGSSPHRAGNTWELRQLPARPAQLPRLALTLLPNQPALPRFATWSDVAGWLATRSDAAAQPTPPVIAQAESLTAGLTTPQQRIQALAAYVQGLRYVAINQNLGQGGGFTPAPAATVLSRGYGDCKDKATLLRALLRAVNINSWLVATNSSDRARVRPEWPSPRVFNHAIIAIEAPSGLLYFDPSDPHHALGGLPPALQGAPALFLRSGASLAMTPEQAGAIERQITLRLEHDGRVSGKILETAHGSAAAATRALVAAEMYDSYLSSRLGIQVTQLKIQDSFPEDGLHMYVEYEQAAPVATAGPLHVWKPLLPWLELPGPVAVNETVTIELHPRWIVEEMPEPVQSASFSGAWFLEDGKLIINRQLRPSSAGVIPVERLPIVLRQER